MSDNTELNESSEDGSESGGVEASEGTEKHSSRETSAAGDNFKPITSQQELEAALKDRLDRERAKFKDYGDLKEKAKKFDEAVEAQKSELQKAIERAEAAEGAMGALKAAEQIREWKSQVAKQYGVPADVIRGTDLEEIEEHAKSLKAVLPEPRKPGSVPGEGRQVTPGTGDPAQQFAELIRNARK